MKEGGIVCRVGRSSRVGFKDYKFIMEGVNEWQDVWVPDRAEVTEDQSGRKGTRLVYVMRC